MLIIRTVSKQLLLGVMSIAITDIRYFYLICCITKFSIHLHFYCMHFMCLCAKLNEAH